jgi:hypothetical protein
LAQGNFEVVRVVQGVHEIAVEGMNVLESWKAIQNSLKLLGKRFRRVLHFPGVELFAR